MEVKNKQNKKLMDAYRYLLNFFPTARIYDLQLKPLPQDKDSYLLGETATDPTGRVRRMAIDPRFAEQAPFSLGHEMIHTEEFELGKGSPIHDPKHNEKFVDILYNRLVRDKDKTLKQLIDERSKKLSPYEILIKKEQEKVLGKEPDLFIPEEVAKEFFKKNPEYKKKYRSIK